MSKLKKKEVMEKQGKGKKAVEIRFKKITRKLLRVIGIAFSTEVPDNLLLGEIRVALASPNRRVIIREELAKALLISGKMVKDIAQSWKDIKPPWMSELTWKRVKKTLRVYKKIAKKIQD